MNANLDNQIFSKIKTLNQRDLIIFLIPFIIFAGYLFIYNPGILTYDSYNQLHQIATGHFDNWHPFFHTFIEMVLLKIYANPIIIPIVQILTFSTIWMTICKYNRNDNQKSSKNFKIQVIITLIIALIPINAIYSITLWKDILFSYLLLLTCFLIQVLLDKKGQIDIKFAVLISVTMAFVAQLRPNGIVAVIPLLAILAIYLFLKNKNEKFYLVIPALTIIIILLISSLSVIYDVEDTGKDAVFSKTIHLLADYDLNLDLSQEDKDKIHEIISEDDIKENYNILFTDPIRDISNQSVYDNDKATYLTMAIKYSILNPVHFIKYMFGSCPMVWNIVRDDSWNGKAYYFDSNGPHLNYARDKFYTTHYTEPAATFDNVTSVNEGTGKFSIMNSIVSAAKDNVMLDTLFNSPALYMYLAFIAMAGIYFLTRSRDVLLIYLPNFLSTLSIFLSVTTQDTRFVYGNLLAFYLLAIIFVKYYLEYKGESVPKSADGSSENIHPNNFQNQQNIRRLNEKPINQDDIYARREPINQKDIYAVRGEPTKLKQPEDYLAPLQETHEEREEPTKLKQPEDYLTPKQETQEEMENRIIAEILKEMEEGKFDE